jgi:AcrR family transcriptional regulator
MVGNTEMHMRDAEATRRRILDAAREEFSKFGPAGARINRIAAASGANKERIYANFGSKEGLFEAVMSDTLAAHSDTVGEWGESAADLVDRLQQTHERSPELLRLMLWEALEFGSDPVPDEEKRRAYYRQRVSALQKAFGLDSETDSAAALLTLIGLAAWPAAMPQWKKMLRPEGQAAAFETAQCELAHRIAKTVLGSKR